MFEKIRNWFRRGKKEKAAEVHDFTAEAKPLKAEPAEEVTAPESRYTEDYKKFVEDVTSEAAKAAEEVRKNAALPADEQVGEEEKYVPSEEDLSDPFADVSAMENDEEEA